MASLTNLFGAYASDEEGEASGDLKGADGLGSGVVLLDRDADVLETAAAPAERAERRQSSEPADEEASGFPWATPEGMAAVTGGTPKASGQQKTDGDPEAMQEATAGAEDDAGGAGQQLRLPPELAQAPPGPVDPALQAKVEKLMRTKMATGKRITVELKSMRAYRNPDFLQKMVDFFGIDHTGTCYSLDVWDPKRLPPEDFYDRLAAEFEEKRKQDRSEQGKAGRLEFVRPASGPDLTRLPAGGDLAAQMVATAKAAATAKASATAAGAARRASKWDAGRK